MADDDVTAFGIRCGAEFIQPFSRLFFRQTFVPPLLFLTYIAVAQCIYKLDTILSPASSVKALYNVR